MLPMALPRAIGFSSSGGRLGQYENNKKAYNQQKSNSGRRWHTWVPLGELSVEEAEEKGGEEVEEEEVKVEHNNDDNDDTDNDDDDDNDDHIDDNDDDNDNDDDDDVVNEDEEQPLVFSSCPWRCLGL